MSPSYSTKNGIRYRFYVSSALLRGRKAAAGSVARVAAAEIEGAVLAALKTQQQAADACDAIYALERVIVARSRIVITTASDDLPHQEIVIPWTAPQKDVQPTIEGDGSPIVARNDSLIQSIVRAHAWMHLLQDGTYASVEGLADANNIHPKVIRQNLRLAYLSPEVTIRNSGGQPTREPLAGTYS